MKRHVLALEKVRACRLMLLVAINSSVNALTFLSCSNKSIKLLQKREDASLGYKGNISDTVRDVPGHRAGPTMIRLPPQLLPDRLESIMIASNYQL